jgi:tRNA (guanine10-N2)-dimethyltransferase
LPLTSGRSKNRSLVLLSGEGTTLPEAEARALFLAYDPASRFESPERRVLLVDSAADPLAVSRRVAFSRRVGRLIADPADAAEGLHGKSMRFQCFTLGGAAKPPPEEFLKGVDARVDLERPDYELTLVRGERDYLALTSPCSMRQAWSRRRPRARAFFHPSAIFPKLSRALVNLSRCKEGEVFLDPFAGTGSIPIEAALAGARVVAVDVASKMARGSLSNMRQFGQDWLGVLRADAFSLPLTGVGSMATDVPYGRASSTRGRGARGVIDEALSVIPGLLRTGSLAVLMHPQWSGVEGTAELSVEEEHHLYIHKLLTRTITVLRRR